MNDDLHISDVGANLIQGFESLQLKAYIDTKDKHGDPIYAIGWGHAGSIDNVKITSDTTITEDEAKKLFFEDAKIYEDKVKKYVTVPLNQNQFDALVCMAYNVSTAHFVEMLEISELNKGIYDKVPDAMLHYNISGGRILRGLTRRRKEEGVLFMTPAGQVANTDNIVS
jgi:lysozyme